MAIKTKKKRTPNAAEIEAEAKRLKEAAGKKSAALDAVAEAEAKERELTGDLDDLEELPPEPEPTKLERILEELQDEGCFTVSYMLAGNPSKMGQYPLNEWPEALEQCARTKGGGTFKVIFRDGAGHYKHQFTQTFDAETYGQFKKPETNGNGSGTGPVGGVMEGFTAMMQMMMQQQQQSNAMMIEVIKSNNQTPQGKGMVSSTSDVIALAKLFQGDKKSPFEDMREMVTMLNALKEEAEEDTPFERAIDKAFSVLGPILEAGAARLGAANQPPDPGKVPPVRPAGERAVLPAPGQPVVSPQPVAASVSENHKQQVIEAFSKQLKAAIENGGPPAATATFVVSSVSGQDRQDLYDFCIDRANIDAMIKAEPTLQEFRGWLDTFFTETVSSIDVMVKGESETQDVSEPEPKPKTVDPKPEYANTVPRESEDADS